MHALVVRRLVALDALLYRRSHRHSERIFDVLEPCKALTVGRYLGIEARGVRPAPLEAL